MISIELKWYKLNYRAITMLYSDDLYLSPARSKRGNLGPCPRPWRGVVTDPPTHSYLPDLGRYQNRTIRAME